MKIRKKSEQKNFIVNKYYYNNYQLTNMVREGIIVCDYKDFSAYRADEETFRIGTYDCKEVKVILDAYGFYTTVAVTHDGTMIYIEL